MILFHRAALLSALLFTTAYADPLTKTADVHFGRDVSSRNINGLATRSDGRVLPGPAVKELGVLPADLVWTIRSSGPERWLVGTGPDGKVLEITLNDSGFSSRELVALPESQIFALAPLGPNRFLAGTSPNGALYLIDQGRPVARISLPVDSIWDIVQLPPQDGAVQVSEEFLIATGNPGRIYRLDVAAFSRSGLNQERISDPADLASRGLHLWSEIRDRNVRRLAVITPDRIVAGSAPRGTLYSFPRTGGTPFILHETRDGEVTDLLPGPDGGFFASMVYGGRSPADTRIPPARPAGRDDRAGGLMPQFPQLTMESFAAPTEFSGRSELLWLPERGVPEVVSARNGRAFYSLAQHYDTVVIGAGERGEVLGYDTSQRLNLIYPGTVASQVTALLPVPGKEGGFLMLNNNLAGLALLDFNSGGERELVTDNIDLGQASELGNLRFSRFRNIAPEGVQVSLRVGNSTDEAEGWSPWIPASDVEEDAFFAAAPSARYVRVKLAFSSKHPANFEVGQGRLYFRNHNRPPRLADFRVFPPNLGIVPAPEPATPTVLSLAQLLMPPSTNEAEKRRNTFLASQVVAQPGSQVVIWSVTDPDGDALSFSFAIRRHDAKQWIEIASHIRDSYVQFDTSDLPDGLYFTRLTATELPPRSDADRLSLTYETDDLIIDKTPPEILDAHIVRRGDSFVITVEGRDRTSLLRGVEVAFNNGYTERTTHPIDGVLDGRQETFRLTVPAARAAGATSVEIYLQDQSRNIAARRLAMP